MPKKKYPFSSTVELDELIKQYFESVGTDKIQRKGRKPANNYEKISNIGEHPTIAGLAFHLGFNSREDFEACESKGKFSSQLKRSRLRIMADYEKKLHVTSSTGAIFALKNMGWNDKAENKPATDVATTTLKIKIIQTGPPLVSSEAEVTL